MAKRTTKEPSLVFRSVLDQAEKRLELEADAAANFEHKGLRGDERAAALADFLRQHLPSVFSVGKGEVIDYGDRRSGELIVSHRVV